MRLLRSSLTAAAVTAVTATLTLAAPSAFAADGTHAVFVATNDVTDNQIITYAAGADGRLAEAGRYDTGGVGANESGAAVDPLASQGSLTYDAGHRLLYAVNGGSDTLSVFAVHGTALHLVQTLATDGVLPVSVGVAGDTVYVLNAGGDGSITGFRVRGERLKPIADSTRSLSLGNPDNPPFLKSPAQVAVTPDASAVVVSTKTHTTLVVFPLDASSRPTTPTVNTSPAPVPFALSFDAAGRLIVGEASGGASSYTVSSSGALTAISTHVANGQAATCWSVVAKGYIYMANAGSNTITGYREAADGTLSLLDANGVTATTDGGPVDLAVSGDGNFLYQEATGAGAIDEFSVNADGSLTRIGTLTGFPPDSGSGMEGIAAS